ncbi:hypothetical protein AB0J21_03730 [Streptomyces sp. NPDC049954]|uniref:hypothetical protein n=1 Tax=Streptomyces sp. NPDC049954 TaxID=3155779 RepID=UPI0034326102
MVTSPHEASHRIFQDRPELLSPVFRILDVPLPPKITVDVLSADVTEIRPLERRVDSVLRVSPSTGEEFLLAIEAQGRRDKAKPATWAYYLAYLMAKYECPALLLVVCQDRGTATWASAPAHLGTDGWSALILRPLVLGPDNVPVITDPAEAASDLALASFSAMTHARHRQVPDILEALSEALSLADPESVKYYSELLEVGLGHTPARDTWRKLMPGTYFPGRGTLIEETYLEGRGEGREEGRAEGVALSVLRILRLRGVDVPEPVSARVLACTDRPTLDGWLDRALTAGRVEDLFTDAEEPAPATGPR